MDKKEEIIAPCKGRIRLGLWIFTIHRSHHRSYYLNGFCVCLFTKCMKIFIYTFI